MDVLKEHPSFHRVHLLADTHEAGTQVHVHAVQGVGHGVHGVDHKLDLALLLVLRVSTDPLVTCSQEDRSWRGEGIKFQETQLDSQCPRVCPCIPVHFLRPSSYFMPGRVSLHLKSSSQNSANHMFLLLFSRDLEVKYSSNPWVDRKRLKKKDSVSFVLVF